VEFSCEGGFDFLHTRGGAVENLLNGGDGTAGEAAGDDEVEVGEVRVDVERDAVHGNTTANANSEGANLVELAGDGDPDADGLGVGLRGEVEFGEGGDDGLLEAANVGTDGELVVEEANDGVGDNLAGAVEGDIAPAVGLDDLDTELGELVGGGDEVSGDAGAAAEGDNRGVFNQKKGFRAASEDGGVGLLLDGPGAAVGKEAEIAGEHGEIIGTWQRRSRVLSAKS